MQESKVHSHISGRNVRPFVMKDVSEYESLKKIGLGFDSATLSKMAMAQADSLTGLTTTASIPTPIQFAQQFLPGFVQVATAVRKIDEICGIMTAGEWEHEEIVQGMLEPTGTPLEYGDLTNMPLGSWNLNWERRTIVRHEQGMRVGALEDARAGLVKVNNADEKRFAAMDNLEIVRNKIGFYGYNNGANRTYGLLNDVNLNDYETVVAGASGHTPWATKTFNEIITDIITAASLLRTQSGGVADVNDVESTLVVPLSGLQYLNTPSALGYSVMKWIQDTFGGKMRVIATPQFEAAHGGANVFYLFADKVAMGNSTDGGATIIQVVPAKFKVIGVQPLAKGFEEDFSNATAGVMVKRPMAVVRYAGI